MNEDTRLNLLELYFHTIRELKIKETHTRRSIRQDKELKQLKLLKENLEIILGNDLVIDMIP